MRAEEKATLVPSIKIKGKSVAYEEQGRGKSVVFVHGACENSSFWNQQKSLADRYRVITMDLPGHGKSESLDGEILVKSYSDFVAEFIQKVCPDKAILVGHSLGGAIALLNVIEHCDNLMGAVIVSSGAKLGVLPSIREGLRARFEETVKTVVGPRQFSTRTNLDTIRFVTNEILKCDSMVAAADFDACNSFDVRQRLRSISVPILIIAGEEDKMSPVPWSIYLKENIPKARLVVIREASHLPMIERPFDFNRHLNEFLMSV